MSGRFRPTLVICFAAVALVVATGSARAESALVVLVRPASADARASEVLNLARGELVADRFRVLLVDALAGTDRAAALSEAASDAGADVSVGIFIDGEARAIELWLVNRPQGRVLVRRLEGQNHGTDDAPVLARRTVDVIRAGLFELLFESLRPPVPDAKKSVDAVPVRAAAPPRWAVEFGIGALGSFDRIGTAVAPVVGARLALGDWQIRALGSWLGSHPGVEAKLGPEPGAPTASATVDQGVALIEGLAQLWPRRPLHASLCLGAGAFYAGVDGTAARPLIARHDAQVAFALDGGVGLPWRLGSHFELTLEARLILTVPGIRIRLANVDSATLGHPSFLVTLTLASWI